MPERKTQPRPPTPLTVTSLYALLMDVNGRLSQVEADIEGLQKTAEANVRTLRGTNGDPGIVGSLYENKTRINAIQASIDQVQAQLSGHIHQSGEDSSLTTLNDTIYGQKDNMTTNPGLINQVDDLVKWHALVEKWQSVIFGAIVLFVINQVLAIWPQVVAYMQSVGR